VPARGVTVGGMTSPPGTQVLLVTADELLLDDLLRLCAAAGVTPEVRRDVTGAHQAVSTARLVVVGADLVETLAASGLVRRGDLVVATLDAPTSDLWMWAVRIGAEDVVDVGRAQEQMASRLADVVDGSGLRCLTVAVVGGCGGAGATTLAAGLAITGSALGFRVLLVDGDPLGGGIDLAVGAELSEGLRWPDLAGTVGRVSASSLRAALPSVGELAVMSWDRGNELTIRPEIMREVLRAGQRGNHLVVVDLPRRLDPAAREALAAATTTVLTLPAQVRAIAAAGRVKAPVAASARDLRLVVRAPGPSGLSARLVADTLSLPLLGELRHDPAMPEAMDRGFGPCRRRRGALSQLCRHVLDQLGLSEPAAA